MAALALQPARSRTPVLPLHRFWGRLPSAGFDFRYGPHPGPMKKPIAPALKYEDHPEVTFPEWDNGFVSRSVFPGAGPQNGDEEE